MKNRLEELHGECVALASLFLNFAEKYKHVPMPGYSHTQQAMLSSVGHYFSAYAESLLDDANFLILTRNHIDKNPLGSAAGFGTTILVDRNYTARMLGFAEVQINTLYCQNSRGKFESVFLEGLAQIMMTLGKFASDMILFTSQEFDFFDVDDSFVTGSSIMPQKRNMDTMEILRGNASVVAANQALTKNLCEKLPSGYNRDFQLLKKPLIESADIVRDSLRAVRLTLEGIAPKENNMIVKITPGIFAADIANKLVEEKGVPFRDAYKEAFGRIYKEKFDFKKNIAAKKTLGAPGNLSIKKLRKRIREEEK